MKLILALIPAAVVFVSPSWGFESASMRSADPAKFDVAGVRLGMDMKEALVALSKGLGVRPSEIKTDPHRSMNSVTGKIEPHYIYYDQKGIHVEVSFVGRVPVDKNRPLVVWSISYFHPNNRDSDTLIRAAAIEKYGRPSTKEQYKDVEMWCFRPTVVGCPSNVAIASLSGGRLNLSDVSWKEKARQYAAEKRATIKPRL